MFYLMGVECTVLSLPFSSTPGTCQEAVVALRSCPQGTGAKVLPPGSLPPHHHGSKGIALNIHIPSGLCCPGAVLGKGECVCVWSRRLSASPERQRTRGSETERQGEGDKQQESRSQTHRRVRGQHTPKRKQKRRGGAHRRGKQKKKTEK